MKYWRDIWRNFDAGITLKSVIVCGQKSKHFGFFFFKNMTNQSSKDKPKFLFKISNFQNIILNL